MGNRILVISHNEHTSLSLFSQRLLPLFHMTNPLVVESFPLGEKKKRKKENPWGMFMIVG
jgi:hypothetical protein